MKYLKAILITAFILTILTLAIYHTPFYTEYYEKETTSNNMIHIKKHCSCLGLTIQKKQVSFNNSYTTDVICQGANMLKHQPNLS